ncbi:adult-specific rigid cuticular protein 15.7-like [Limulus polyphemus]|uniref:Adult-specific rigid cuticular protein 15.7-like n=1 Tax=Limulus polyphemus TaxID=6850 RepID=A0ABM1SWM1_LIMPO|nr:adult-specific rigid cuticular protein 15.7-like [Limulus polyphemus]
MLQKVLLLSLVIISTEAKIYRPYQEVAQPQPYDFGYEINDKKSGSNQFRKEQSDSHGGVRGSYGYTDASGIYRQVDYIADHNGYRAVVKTNEPGTSNQDSAGVKVLKEPTPPLHHLVPTAAKPQIYPSPNYRALNPIHAGHNPHYGYNSLEYGHPNNYHPPLNSRFIYPYYGYQNYY